MIDRIQEQINAQDAQLIKEQARVTQLLIDDLVKVAAEVGRQRSLLANMAATLGALATTLVDKGLITESEIQAVWDRDMKPVLQAAHEELSDNKLKPS